MQPTEEQVNDIMNDYNDLLIEEAEKQIDIDMKVVDPIIKEESSAFKELFKEYTEDSNNYNFRVTDKNIATSEESTDTSLKLFIDQSAGYTGDDYTGTISLEMSNGKYLSWDYSM